MDHVKVIVFDANETLLDLSALDPLFARAFGDPGTRALWFTQLLQLFLTATVIDAYQPFDVLGDAALDVVATSAVGRWRPTTAPRFARRCSRCRRTRTCARRLDRLRAAKLRLAVLTNSTEKSAKAQMRHAGLTDYFDAILSADAVRCGFRPKAITRFAPSRSPVSPEADHSFRSKAITRFAEGDPDVGG